MFQRDDQAAHKRGRLSKTYVSKVSYLNIKRSKTFLECNQAIKANFRESKILIPVANGSTVLMKVTTPLCILVNVRFFGWLTRNGGVKLG